MIKISLPKIENLFKIGKDTLFKINLSRKKFIISFILGLCQSRSVEFEEIALHLNDAVVLSSNMRRIQRFFAEYALNYRQFAILFMSFIPEKRYRLCIDRTNWKFGCKSINIFALTVYYKGVGIPILFEMLEKSGNSNQEERISLLERFVAIFGHKCIKSLLADREFIGEKWFHFLVEKEIKFHIRIPKSHYICLIKEKQRADFFLNKYGKKKLIRIFYQNLDLYLAMDFSKNKQGKADPLFILTNEKNRNALRIYKQRWSIEVFFQSLKGRGFKFEKTHLKDTDRIAKLFVLASLTFIICLCTGIYYDALEKKIPIKNHGYKAKSFFRYGADILRKVLKKIEKSQDEFKKIIALIVDFTSSVFEICLKRTISETEIKNVM